MDTYKDEELFKRRGILYGLAGGNCFVRFSPTQQKLWDAIKARSDFDFWWDAINNRGIYLSENNEIMIGFRSPTQTGIFVD